MSRRRSRASIETIAEMMTEARPLHEVIKVDAFIHGCPPTADQIWFAVSELLQGRMPAFSPVYLRYRMSSARA